MANLTLTPTWDGGVYRIETTDPVMGGENGISNKGAKNLGNRTEWLKQRLDSVSKRGLGSISLLRQAIVTGRHGADGKPNYATYTAGSPNVLRVFASDSNPLIIAFSGGYDVDGPVNYYGYINSDSNFSVLNNTSNIVFAEYEVASGNTSIRVEQITAYTATTISYIQPPLAQNGDYWYDLRSEKMFKYNEAWEQVFRVAIATIGTGGGGSVIYPKNIGLGFKDLYGRTHVPAGTVMSFAGVASFIPPGYLLCDGAAVSRAVYADLYAAILGNYGNGNGTTTFNIPDLRGEFIRGMDNGRGVDPSRVIGSSQTDMLKSHTHSLNPLMMTDLQPTPGIQTGVLNNAGTASAANVLSFGGTETRPRNVAMNYIIKF